MLMKITTTMGDAVDRLSILQIKHDLRMPINTAIYMELLPLTHTEGYMDLLDLNKELWDIEDQIREAHSHGDMYKIVSLSREIITKNKKRAEIKAKIDENSGAIPEPKAYFDAEN